MTLYDYEVSRELVTALRQKSSSIPFYALVMAAMRQADTVNLAKLQAAWPEVWNELEQRYNTPGGRLPGDPTRSKGEP